MSKYSHKCCWCGKKFIEMSIPIMRQHLVFECKEWPGNKIVSQMTARNEELTSKLVRMEAAGDAMKNMVIRKNHYHQYTCDLCDAYADTVNKITHAPDCPVTLWLASKKEE